MGTIADRPACVVDELMGGEAGLACLSDVVDGGAIAGEGDAVECCRGKVVSEEKATDRIAHFVDQIESRTDATQALSSNGYHISAVIILAGISNSRKACRAA